MPQHLAILLIDELQLKMEIVDLASSIPFSLQCIAALNFYGSGSYQRRVGMDSLASISQTSRSRIVNKISQGTYK